MLDSFFQTPNEIKADAAIYVHWPFCLKKCPYCDFNSHVRDQVDHDGWSDALLQEIDTFAAKLPNLRSKSIFFGGGTPSLMEAATVERVITKIKDVWPNLDDIEITLEANPSSVEAEKFLDYKSAGVNRLSVGIQSLRDDALKFLGRLHSAEEALSALDVARETFDRVSFDLIYARPEQSLGDWRKELSEALQFEPSHLSLYQLTIEEGTAFYHQYNRGKFTLPDEEGAAALYDLTQELTEKAGLPAYEISNHARRGEESQHNLAYWQGDFYVGIGPGAHGRLPGAQNGEAVAHNQIKRPEDWLSKIQAQGHGTTDLEPVDADTRAIEILMMGLRLKNGINLEKFEKHIGKVASSYLDADALSTLTQDGYVHMDKNSLSLTPKGLPVLNHCLAKLLA